MHNVFGIVVIIGGFLVPFVSGGRMPSTIVFWFGFLLLLWPNKKLPIPPVWFKWARIGLLANIAAAVLAILVLYLATHSSLVPARAAVLILHGAGYLFQPVSTLSDFIVPFDQVVMPDGSYRFTIGPVRAALCSFFDIAVCIAYGIVIGRIISSREKKRLKGTVS